MRSCYKIWPLLGLLIIGFGCSKTPSAPTTATEPTADAATSAEPKKEAIKVEELPLQLPEGERRSSVTGRWLLTPNARAADSVIAIVEIAPNESEKQDAESAAPLSAKIVEIRPQYKWTIKSAEIDPQNVHIVFVAGDDQETEIDFQGTLQDGIVYGNLFTPKVLRCDKVRLVPTEETSLAKYHPSQNASGKQAWDAARLREDKFAAMREFCEKNPTSPIAVEMYDRLLAGSFGSLKSQNFDSAAAAKLAEDYLNCAGRWGDRLQAYARYGAGFQLAIAQEFPDLALEYLSQAEAKSPAEIKEPIQSMVADIRPLAELTIARRRAEEVTADTNNEEASKVLHELIEKHPLDPFITFKLARFALNQNQSDEALEMFGRLAVVPMMERQLVADPKWQQLNEELPSETVQLLWRANHNDKTDGLQEFLSSVYKTAIERFITGSAKPPAEKLGNQIALCEHFTGAHCGPCVASDMASQVLERDYPENSHVIVLQHHLHAVAPDPLTNEDSERRFEFYIPDEKRRSLPQFYVNGLRPAVSVGGTAAADAPRIYRILRQFVDRAVAENTPVSIALSANVENGVLKITADATGVPQDASSDSLRLVVALAEDSVDYTGGNGMRQHHLVVRTMFSAPEGIENQGGKLSFSDSISIADLRSGQNRYLDEFEAKNPGNSFSERPLELKSLKLVAFVQNHDQQDPRILQAAITPVTGDLGSAPTEPPAAAATVSP